MSITLTCPCGQKQTIANEMAGQPCACVACGKTLTAPAMGKIVPAKAKAKAAPVRLASSSRHPAVAGIVLGSLLLLAVGGWLAWSLIHEPDEPTRIAQEVEVKSPAASPEPEKKDPPRAPTLPLVEETPTAVNKPVEPKTEPTKPVVEPELPKTAPKEPIVEKKPANVIEPLKLVWKLKADDTFFQELIVLQKPIFKSGPLVVPSLLQYRIVSRFTVKKRNDDGSLVVEQKIESAKLMQADDLTKLAVAGSLERMPGTTYKLELSPKMDVTKFEAGPAAPAVVPFGGGLGLQMTALLDRDGWKELAQTTFFQIDQPLKVNAKWSKPMTHNWGALGSWSGQIHYLYAGQQKNLHKVAYGLQLKHKAPAAGAIGLMKINAANFQTQQAEGFLLFDAVRGKVTHAEELFRVKGIVNANVFGQNTLIEIDEDQQFLIRIHDKLDAVK